MNIANTPFPTALLPPLYEDGVNALTGRYGLQSGAIAMAVFAFYGAAVGGRVQVPFSSRRHELNLPLAVVTPPSDEAADCLGSFALLFRDEEKRLQSLKEVTVDHFAQEKRCRTLLTPDRTPIPPTPA